MKKLGDLRNVLGKLEPEGQGREIIMEVIHLHLIEPFHYIVLY